ncbi:uncharacterized protein OCT59_022144 [Rhizophagus irregularis]|nr:hypothetical protein OCT59_022144 [Rhizophagus irregularis]GBC51906.1 hypothetical protein GLOIN_2v1534436 [Rhizophagus irregularis DAOM 181602=DAOM 197198]
MALSQKKRFTFFGSPPMSPVLSPTKNLSSYFSQEDKLPNIDDARKAVDNLERLVVAAEAYRDLINKLSKASKTFSKTLKEYGNSKGMDNVHVMCFQTTSQFYENHNEIQSKLNKALQKDFDSIQKFWDKYSKRVTKDEKAHNDYVGDLDKQLKKMGKDYEKKTKKESKSSLESHNQYMTSVSNVGSEIVRAQKEYAGKVVKREKHTHSIISQVVCKLAEGHFAYFNESLKKCGPAITKMKEWAPFAGEDMPPPQDLDSFLEDQETRSQSDKNSTISERHPVSIASISEKQIAAMNFSQESKFQLNEEPENIIPRYVQMPEPKQPIITIPVTTNSTYARPNSLIFDNLNTFNTKNDENATSSSPTSSVPSTPIVQPTSTLPVYTSSFDSKAISRFSIGVRDNDNLFLRDEKVVEIHHPEVVMESKVEKSVLNQHFSNQFKNQEEKSNESQKATNDIKKNEKKDDEKKYDEKKGNEEKVNEKKDSEKRGNEKEGDEKKVNEKIDDEKKDDEKKDDEKKDDEKKVKEKKDNVKKDDEKKDIEKKGSDSEKKGSGKKDNETSIKLQNEHQSEKKDIFTFAKHSPLDNIVHNRSSISDDSNTTLNDNKKNREKLIEELKIDEESETKKKASLSEKSNEIGETTKITINKFEEKETTYKKESLIDNNKLKVNGDDSLYKSMNQQIPSESPRLIPAEVQFKNKEILLNNSSSPQLLLQSRYSRDDDYREEYLREDTELYDNEIIRVNEMNRYPNREIIYRDESLLYNSSVPGERMRYNDNYHRTQQYVDDDYESYDYTPSQNRGPYVTRDGSPPRASLPYSQRPYSNSVPLPTANRSSSVREMTNRFQSLNDERRTMNPTRNIPIQTTGRVSEMTSRFGERRHKRDEIINPMHINNPRNGYENVDDRYNEQIEYRNGRYIQYEDDIHDGITPVPHCNCHNCRMAIESPIIINNRRHNNPAPFNSRTDMRKSYR